MLLYWKIYELTVTPISISLQIIRVGQIAIPGGIASMIEAIHQQVFGELPHVDLAACVSMSIGG